MIEALAKRWADRRYGGCSGVHAMRKGIHRGTLAAYMRNWLLEHGELPAGRHKVTVHDRKTGPFTFDGGFAFTVDFTRLLTDPGYPESESREYRRLHDLDVKTGEVISSRVPRDPPH